MLSGRVKTLHPAVHAGILARNLESDEQELADQGLQYIDYVICNLFVFLDSGKLQRELLTARLGIHSRRQFQRSIPQWMKEWTTLT